MNRLTDQQLLREYAGPRWEAAFAELVRRHVDFVHSAAARMVCDAHLAEDVTQSVFAALAQNARLLAEHPVLSGWLHRTAQNLAANVVRSEVRRRAREQEAAAMNELLANEPAAGWKNIASHLDAALGELNEADRDAVLLRYFEKKSAREMAEILGVSDEAAQKRVSRAVERLRELFSQRNVTIGASGLAAVIAANAVQAAPAGLALTICTATLAGTAISTSTVIAATKAIAMTTLQKTVITAVLAAAAGTGIFEAHQAAQLRGQVQTLQQSQAPLAEQIQQLQQERNDATNRLAGMAEELAKNQKNNLELLKLRGEVSSSMRASDDLVKDNENLKIKLSELEGRWFNVTNSPQFSMPYLSKDHWAVNGGGGPLEKLVAAAKAATENDESKLNELVSEKALPLFSKKRWDKVEGIQVVGVDYLTNNGEETATVNTIVMEKTNAPSEPGQPAALDELLHTYPVMRRWSFSKTDQGWVITGVN